VPAQLDRRALLGDVPGLAEVESFGITGTTDQDLADAYGAVYAALGRSTDVALRLFGCDPELIERGSAVFHAGRS
jgi:lysophospholipase L1-like esterase